MTWRWGDQETTNPSTRSLRRAAQGERDATDPSTSLPRRATQGDPSIRPSLGRATRGERPKRGGRDDGAPLVPREPQDERTGAPSGEGTGRRTTLDTARRRRAYSGDASREPQ